MATIPFYNPQTFSPTIVMSAVSLAALSFLGFAAISTLTAENLGQKNQVGKAMVIVLFLMWALYVLQTWTAGMAWSAIGSLQADKDNAFYIVAAAVGGTSLKVACQLATAVCWGFSAVLAAQTAVSRILFSMSRDGLSPLLGLLVIGIIYRTFVSLKNKRAVSLSEI
ncbi:amino acid permease-associated region [Pseudogulbenkiania sp. NH8B]|uniref:APC family permease n=1 Tax=Pseudogulbenkiania sp. (strain NH8B) TaxID=748280 RepID=UPI00022798D6|nr:APC family permease [Pseudogulbenkiania sp. NH8B]BAK76798.1 amino acid permease-associated region [Pseudogulbenkiania sp. NH8B]